MSRHSPIAMAADRIPVVDLEREQRVKARAWLAMDSLGWHTLNCPIEDACSTTNRTCNACWLSAGYALAEAIEEGLMTEEEVGL